jgi:surfactin synthase thioesterase subunit
VSQAINHINDTDKWLPVRPGGDASVRLFCLPFAGGGPGMFKQWPGHLAAFAPDVQLCPIALPGREKRLAEPLIREMSELTDILADLLSPFLDRPFILYGHCFGGSVAFDLVLKLQKRNHPPVLLAVSGSRAPHLPAPATISSLPRDDFAAALRAFSLTPDEVLNIPELLELFIPLLRADFFLDESYRYTGPRPGLSCPVLAMYGRRDAVISPDLVLPWREYSSSGVTLSEFEGGHVFFADDPTPMLRAIVNQMSNETAS